MPKLYKAKKTYRYVVQDARSATRVTNSKAAALKLVKAMMKKDPLSDVSFYDEATGEYKTFKAKESNPGQKLRSGEWTPTHAVRIRKGKLEILR